MKILTILLAMPMAAQAMGMPGGMHGAMRSGAMHCGMPTHLAIALYALLAALGYWVLQHAAKETANYVKKAGQTLGWAFIVVGLLGILCGVASHAKNMCHKNSRCSDAKMMGENQPDGNMPMMHPNCPMRGEEIKKPPLEKKK
ncbi:MAG TPA: hypothetical protein DCL44_01785 [Elusimicrobia bacterium]|nr:hypothetical protein [Elusimicrobiota bacterium]